MASDRYTEIAELFPHQTRVLLTGTGKDFVQQIGIEAVKRVIVGVLTGRNVRDETEPLTRRRIGKICGAMLTLFTRGWATVPDFTDRMSTMALSQIKATSSDKSLLWPSQWILGLTGKSIQNVLGKGSDINEYIRVFEQAIKESSEYCQHEMGTLNANFGLVEENKTTRTLNWHDLTRLTTALGCAALTIRGSDKSTYGKLFERLILGSVLSLMGFKFSPNPATRGKRNVFWLSDSANAREADATVIIVPGKVARIDIGFIGPGNSEISKDKLTRFQNQIQLDGSDHRSQTFIIVDRLPATSKTLSLASEVGAEIIQMSLSYWPLDLSNAFQKRFGYRNEMTSLSTENWKSYAEEHIRVIKVEDFVSGIQSTDTDIPDLPEASSEIKSEID